MASRELVVLGTASQVPTRTRHHNSIALRWDDHVLLFDPGEGTQRQLLLAGISASLLRHVCLTHFHGDHCLGLPGVVQRHALDRVPSPLHIHFPASGAPYAERLIEASIYDRSSETHLVPTDDNGEIIDAGPYRLIARPLEHRVPTLGWRLDEPDGRRLLPEKLVALGISGPDVGRLQRDGHIDTVAGTVTVDAVSAPRRGQRVAIVMDTRPCANAHRLAEGVDVLVCESTFLEAEADLANAYGHLTARQAGELARDARAGCLVLTHFSQRYPDEHPFAEEAAKAFDGPIHAARDLSVIALPRRRA